MAKKKKMKQKTDETPKVARKEVRRVSVRTNITFPKDMMDILVQASSRAIPKLSINQLVIMLLDYAIKNEMPKIEWIFRYLPQAEKEKIKALSSVSR